MRQLETTWKRGGGVPRYRDIGYGLGTQVPHGRRCWGRGSVNRGVQHRERYPKILMAGSRLPEDETIERAAKLLRYDGNGIARVL